MAKKKIGAPSFEWTDEIEGEILGRIMSGESLVDICGQGRDDFLPSERTFYKRLSDDAAFAQRYARAREAQAHREADEVKALADGATPETVGVVRLQMDARKWRAGKLAAKVYGDKLDVDHSNSDGSMKPTIIQLVARNDGSND